MPVWLPVISDEPQIPEKFLVELGRVIMHWAWFEHGLLDDIRELIKLLEPSTDPAGHSTQIPLAFKKRLKFWFNLSNEAYSTIPNYMEVAQTIRDAASIVANDRNLLVHGFLAGWEPSIEGRVKLYHMRGNALAIYEVDLDKLRSMFSAIKEMNDSLLSLRMNRLLGTHRVPNMR